jgi:hypothetical protein
MRGYVPKYTVFLYAFCGRFRIGNGITGSAVQQSVVAAGGSGCKVETFNKQCAEAAECAVACSSGSGSTAAYNYYVV